MHKTREGYKTTDIGDLPIEWEVRELEELVSIVSGSSPSSFELCEDGLIPFYKVNDMNFCNKYIKRAAVYFDRPENCKYQRGTVIFPKRGASIFTNKIAIMDCDGYFDTNIMGLIANSKVSNEYLYYYLLNMRLDRVADTSSVPQINNKHINPIKIALPALREQGVIVQILSSLDTQIEQTDALIEKTKELKKGLMQRLLTKGIGHTEFRDTEIGRIPKGWGVKRLVEVSDINPESLSNKTDPNYILKYIDIESVTTGKINGTKEFCFAEAPSRARRIVVYNDVIISTVRPYLKAFAIVKTDEDNMICSTGFAVIRAINNNNPDFLFQYTLSDCFINQMSNKMVGSNYPAVNSSDVKESLIAVPTINEQKRIAQVLSEFDLQINELEDKKEKLRILKSGLMDKLLTGRVRVKI